MKHIDSEALPVCLDVPSEILENVFLYYVNSLAYFPLLISASAALPDLHRPRPTVHRANLYPAPLRVPATVPATWIVSVLRVYSVSGNNVRKLFRKSRKENGSL